MHEYNHITQIYMYMNIFCLLRNAYQFMSICEICNKENKKILDMGDHNKNEHGIIQKAIFYIRVWWPSLRKLHITVCSPFGNRRVYLTHVCASSCWCWVVMAWTWASNFWNCSFFMAYCLKTLRLSSMTMSVSNCSIELTSVSVISTCWGWEEKKIVGRSI